MRQQQVDHAGKRRSTLRRKYQGRNMASVPLIERVGIGSPRFTGSLVHLTSGSFLAEELRYNSCLLFYVSTAALQRKNNVNALTSTDGYATMRTQNLEQPEPHLEQSSYVNSHP